MAASALLRDAVRAGLWAAARTGGLVDPTLLGRLEAAGYARSRRSDGGRAARGVPLPSGRPRPARPDPASRWREIRVDDDAGAVIRPPGVRLDLGGSGKGHVADLAAGILDGAAQWAIDCGGDVRVGGARQTVRVAHPLDGTIAAELEPAAGAVATSAITARAWRAGDGTPRHHLIDPATGEPAWTGVVAATALAPTVLEAETLAKAALLLGPERGRRLLAARGGGLLVDRTGRVERVPARTGGRGARVRRPATRPSRARRRP